MRPQIRLLAAALVTLSLVATGCGEGGGSSPEEDAALVERVLLTEDDLPAGWKIEPDDDDDEDDDSPTMSEECRDLEAAFGGSGDFPGQTAEEEANFVHGDFVKDGKTSFLTATVVAADDEGALRDQLDLFRDERVPECLEEAANQQLGKEAPAGTTFTKFEVTTPEPSDLGDEAFAMKATTAMQVQSLRIPLAMDIEIVRVGRVGLLVMTIGLNTDAPADVREQALERMIERASES